LITKAKIKLINSLANKKYREQHQLFKAEGTKNVLDFISGQMVCKEVFATHSWIYTHRDSLADTEVTPVTEAEMKKLTELTTPSEVLALFVLPDYPANVAGSDSLVLMLDDIKDPGNLGTIIRTADWFGIHHIICSEQSTDAFSHKVVQASMGSLARVHLTYANLQQVLSELPETTPVYGALLEGKPIGEIKHQGSGVILIGSEAHGINKELYHYINQPVTIPPGLPTPQGRAESLNASVAASIICYALTSPINSD